GTLPAIQHQIGRLKRIRFRGQVASATRLLQRFGKATRDSIEGALHPSPKRRVHRRQLLSEQTDERPEVTLTGIERHQTLEERPNPLERSAIRVAERLVEQRVDL